MSTPVTTCRDCGLDVLGEHLRCEWCQSLFDLRAGQAQAQLAREWARSQRQAAAILAVVAVAIMACLGWIVAEAVGDKMASARQAEVVERRQTQVAREARAAERTRWAERGCTVSEIVTEPRTNGRTARVHHFTCDLELVSENAFEVLRQRWADAEGYAACLTNDWVVVECIERDDTY